MIRASDSSRSLIKRGRSMMRRPLPTFGFLLAVTCLPSSPERRAASPYVNATPCPTFWEGAGRPRHEGVAAGASSPSAPVVGTRRLQAARQRVLARQQSERDRNLSPPRNAELLPEHVAVGLGRPRRDPEHESDLVVRQTLRDQLDDLPLPRGNARRIT